MDVLDDLWYFNGIKWNQIPKHSFAITEGVCVYPGARSASARWMDSKNNVWLFGGYGTSLQTSQVGYLNDFWRFDGNYWNQISSARAESSLYFYPIKRSNANTWVDNQDIFFLFGGETTNNWLLNDLWKFNKTHWMLIAGDTPNPGHFGRYKTQGNNFPGSRSKGATWVSQDNKLWLYGGFGYGETDIGYLSDLWMFHNEKWTWISGPKNPNMEGENIPSARIGSLTWRDENFHFWMFGGKSKSKYLVDTWKLEQTRHSKRGILFNIGCYSKPPPASYQGDLQSFTACQVRCTDMYSIYLFLFF